MYKVSFFVPASHKEIVKAAMFDAGGGRVGDYDSCSFEVLGIGQFRPLESSNAFIGEKGVLETVEEYKVEMVVKPQVICGVIASLKNTHPYEEVAYEVLKMEEF